VPTTPSTPRRRTWPSSSATSTRSGRTRSCSRWGVASGELIASLLPALGPRGELIITAGSASESIPISPQQLLDGEREIKGCLYGGASPRQTTGEVIDRYLDDDYMLDELITQEYALEEVNEAYENLLGGNDIHSVLKL